MFTTFNRRHHCRLCGHIFCARCTAHEIQGNVLGRSIVEPIRVCSYCFKLVEDSQRGGGGMGGLQAMNLSDLDGSLDADPASAQSFEAADAKREAKAAAVAAAPAGDWDESALTNVRRFSYSKHPSESPGGLLGGFGSLEHERGSGAAASPEADAAAAAAAAAAAHVRMCALPGAATGAGEGSPSRDAETDADASQPSIPQPEGEWGTVEAVHGDGAPHKDEFIEAEDGE